MKLVDQWRTIEDGLPAGWEDVRLTLTTEQPGDLPRAAQVLGSINVGKVGSTLVFHVSRAGGPRAPQAATRLFERLDRDRTWCQLEQSHVQTRRAAAAGGDRRAAPHRRRPRSPRAGTQPSRRCRPTGPTFSASSRSSRATHLDRAALLCAPLNPTRDALRLVFTFRCSGRSGYGVSRSMARRCFERLDNDGIKGIDPRSPCSLRHRQRRHPGARVARGRQDAVAGAERDGHATVGRRLRARRSSYDERALPTSLTVQVSVPTKRDAGRCD